MLKLKENILKYFLIFSLSITLFGLGGVGFFYWNSGLLDGNNLSSVYESSTWLEDIQRNNYIERMQRDVVKSKISSGLKRFERLDIKVRDINRIATLDNEYSHYMKTRNETKAAFEKLLSYPPATDILKIFKNKLKSFEKFVTVNRWPTLSRMSSRMLIRLRKNGGFQYPEILTLGKTIESEIGVMRNVTNRSVLSGADKRLINQKLDEISTESKMLLAYGKDLSKFFQSFKSFKTSYRVWLDKVAPEVSFGKLAVAAKTKQFAALFLGLFCMILLFAISTPFILRRQKKFIELGKERFTLDLFNNKILAANSEFLEGSADYLKEMKRHYAYVQKRMSFGGIMQEALPFPAILLDENLKVIWGNKLFQTDWGISRTQIDGSGVDWELVHRFTNLGDIDPVVDALQSDVSGIFQIQAKLNAEKNPVPYEMYMRPISSSGKRQIMIFFYPLVSMEQTINDQAKGIIQPIQRTLSLMANREFTGKIQEDLQDEFFTAGIDDIYDQLIALQEVQNNSSEDYQEQVNNLREENKELKDTLELITQNVEGIDKVNSNTFQSFRNLKETIVRYSSLANEIFNVSKALSESLGSSMSSNKKAISSGESCLDSLNENLRSYQSLGKINQVFKDLTSSIENAKYDISQSCDQLMVFSRSETIEPLKLEQALTKLKGQIRTLEVQTDQFEKSLKGLDIVISKQEMIATGSQSPVHIKENLEVLNSSAKKIVEQFEDLKTKQRSFGEEVIESEDQLVISLENSFKDFMESSGKTGKLLKVLSYGRTEIQEIEKISKEGKTSQLREQSLDH